MPLSTIFQLYRGGTLNTSSTGNLELISLGFSKKRVDLKASFKWTLHKTIYKTTIIQLNINNTHNKQMYWQWWCNVYTTQPYLLHMFLHINSMCVMFSHMYHTGQFLLYYTSVTHACYGFHIYLTCALTWVWFVYTVTHVSHICITSTCYYAVLKLY